MVEMSAAANRSPGCDLGLELLQYNAPEAPKGPAEKRPRKERGEPRCATPAVASVWSPLESREPPITTN